MWPELFRVGEVGVTVFGTVMAAMFWVVCFGLWKKLKTDYEEERIFMASIVVALMGLVGAYVVYWLGHRAWGMSLVGAAAGMTMGLVVWCRTNRANFWEWADQVAKAGLLLMAVGSAAWGTGALSRAGLALVAWLGCLWVEKNYRRMHWYKSGKPGLVALVVITEWGVVEMLVAFTFSYKVYCWGLIMLAAMVAVYWRACRRPKEDLQKLWTKIKR